MAEAAVAMGQVAPRIIKISSKWQITIPADMYEKSRFSDYAYVVYREDGSIEISPIDVRDEAASVKILRSLLEQGFDGEELVNEYERVIHPVIDYKKAIETGLNEAKAGHVKPFGEMQEALRKKYGL